MPTDIFLNIFSYLILLFFISLIPFAVILIVGMVKKDYSKVKKFLKYFKYLGLLALVFLILDITPSLFTGFINIGNSPIILIPLAIVQSLIIQYYLKKVILKLKQPVTNNLSYGTTVENKVNVLTQNSDAVGFIGLFAKICSLINNILRVISAINSILYLLVGTAFPFLMLFCDYGPDCTNDAVSATWGNILFRALINVILLILIFPTISKILEIWKLNFLSLPPEKIKKNILYSLIVAVIVFVSLAVLVFYYTWPIIRFIIP